MGKRPKQKSKTGQVNIKNDAGINDEKIALATINAISSENDNTDEESDWNAEAKALREAIADGAIDRLNCESGIKIKGKVFSTSEKNRDVLDKSDIKKKVTLEDYQEGESLYYQSESIEPSSLIKNKGNTKGLQSVTTNLVSAKAKIPWSEKFDIIPPTNVHFGGRSKDGALIDVHDDIKRELLFYNIALEAVYEGKKKCKDYTIPFTRPDDFFTEMVKTDDHMAKVKDRLIFETKKMEAFEHRKANREQKLRAKESHAHRTVQKAKAKKKHMQDAEDWAKAVASNRSASGRIDADDNYYLNKMEAGPNKRRLAFSKKYGNGGKRGRFKQNDKKSLNDMSGFNPRGGDKMGKTSAGKKRKGKRARDATRTRN